MSVLPVQVKGSPWTGPLRSFTIVRLTGEVWYEKAFGESYLRTYAHRDDASADREVEQLIGLLGPGEDRVRLLDLCCGNGRHSAAFARRGLDVRGLDLSSVLGRLAGERIELTGRLVRGDMRNLPFVQEFDFVVNLFTSFGYFAEDNENERVILEVWRVLRPGGCLILDHMNRAVAEATVGPEEIKGPDFTVQSRRWTDGDRIRKEVSITRKNGETETILEDVRMYRPEEMRDMLKRVGFRAVDLYGWFNGDPLTRRSKRMIAVGRKA